MSPPGRLKGEHRRAQPEAILISPPGHPKSEHRRAQPEATLMSPPGRPKGERRRAQPEATLMSPPGRPKGSQSSGRNSASTGAAVGGSRLGSKLPGEVRIVGGLWKRSKLPVADVAGLRPTPDRVRETLFNWLGQDLGGWRCLDAFAGSGALGFESASRGAAEVVLLERDRRLAASLNEVKQRLKAETVRVECADALAWMARCAPASFELVFVDPPFDLPLQQPGLAAAARLVVEHGLVYLEADRPCTAEVLQAHGLRLHRSGRAGAVHFQLLQRIPVE